MSQFHYVYMLHSQADVQFYVGYTSDLKRRLAEHKSGKVMSTKGRVPLELVYYEACRDGQDATRREKYLKSAWGKRFLKGRIPNYLTG